MSASLEPRPSASAFQEKRTRSRLSGDPVWESVQFVGGPDEGYTRCPPGTLKCDVPGGEYVFGGHLNVHGRKVFEFVPHTSD